MAEQLRRNFRIVVEKIFNNWQDLRLAVEHGMGGRNGQQLAIQIMDYTYQYCIGNENITQGELEDVIMELMDQEFNTLCDDNSIPEICRNLLRYKQMCSLGQYPQIEAELSKFTQNKDWLRPDVKIVYTAVAGEDSSSEDESGSDDGMDVGMSDDDGDGDGEEDGGATCSRVTRSQTRKKQEEEFVEPEDGWTTVRTRRK